MSKLVCGVCCVCMCVSRCAMLCEMCCVVKYALNLFRSTFTIESTGLNLDVFCYETHRVLFSRFDLCEVPPFQWRWSNGLRGNYRRFRCGIEISHDIKKGEKNGKATAAVLQIVSPKKKRACSSSFQVRKPNLQHHLERGQVNLTAMGACTQNVQQFSYGNNWLSRLKKKKEKKSEDVGLLLRRLPTSQYNSKLFAMNTSLKQSHVKFCFSAKCGNNM